MSRRGALSHETVANPAAGAEFTFTVPAGKWWRPLSLWVQLVQGLTQTPLPMLSLDNGTADQNIAEIPGATAAMAASTTAQFTWGLSIGQVSALIGASPTIRAVAPMPEVVLPAGYRIRSQTQGIGANSDYGVPRLLVVEFDTEPFWP